MSLSSYLKSYGRVDPETEADRLENRRRNRKRIAIIVVSCVVFAVVVVAAVVGTAHRSSGDRKDDKPVVATSVKAVCDVTLYPEMCRSTLLPALGSNINAPPEELLRLSLTVALDQLRQAKKQFPSLTTGYSKLSAAAMKDCKELLDSATDDLASSVDRAKHSTTLSAAADLRTWLSSAGTYIDTCLEGFDADKKLQKTIAGYLKNSTEVTSNGLAIVTWISKLAGSLKLRRLMEYKEEKKLWRRIELESPEKLRKSSDFVVGKDFEDKYKTIGEALKAVKSKNKKRSVIYVKKGVYKENVRVEKNMWNVYMVGDGMNETIVTGSLNVVDGTPTFSTATFAVFGKGFVGREMGFRNTAGPAKHQAVALMASADFVAFHRCRVDAYQDSLYTHSKRQFYRECQVTGTVDFIFGNAAAVFQDCLILPRAPMRGQKNTVTAQGKTDPNQNTGLALLGCTVVPGSSPAELATVETYLGRPWKNYSTTVFANSYISGMVHPTGWLQWTPGYDPPPTIYYAEYKNSGPGSKTAERVNWKGLKKSLSRNEVMKFSVTSFVQGDEWIHDTGVPYKPSV